MFTALLTTLHEILPLCSVERGRQKLEENLYVKDVEEADG